MSSKIWGVVLGLSAVVGCQGNWVTYEQYNRDVNQLREYTDALERDNAALRAKAEAYDRLKNDSALYSAANKTYAELADSLKRALQDLGVDESEVKIQNGTVTFGTDILFDLGSWTLTSRGKQILGTFAKAQKGQHMRIVGHTDRKPIVRKPTKDALETDTNTELSTKRAVAVMGELLKSGVSERQIDSVVGMGSTRPRGSDKDSRRVEIFLVEGQAPLPGAPVKASFQK
ncbi:MAG TPA: OmpA family protein [Planctomycetota bacterium]|nr:OmpA family protein [Planctomycetota bacterium]